MAIYTDHVGLILEAEVIDADSEAAIDISAATTKTITLTAPSGTKAVKTASFTTDGSEGKIRYTTVAGDLSENGRWYAQSHIVTPTLNFYQSIHQFDVLPNL